MVKEGCRDKEMNISKNAVKKKIFTSYPNKKKNEKKMFLSQCSSKYTFNIIPFLRIFHEKKKREMKSMEISRTEKG